MRQEVFVIPGYGIPKDILQDGNYQRYLGVAFNLTHRLCQDRKVRPIVICSGGPTDMMPPYDRTEADEMVRFLQRHLEMTYPEKDGKFWTIMTETRSISTLENLIYVRDVIRESGLDHLYVHYFCEWTRRETVRSLARHILRQWHVIPIDFDLSPNRYGDPKQMVEHRRTQTLIGFSGLQGEAAFEAHHEAFARRLEWLRKAGPERHAEAVRRWSEQELPKLLELLG